MVRRVDDDLMEGEIVVDEPLDVAGIGRTLYLRDLGAQGSETTLPAAGPRDGRRTAPTPPAPRGLPASRARRPLGLGHPYRREWASERMHFPLKAVADAGGWKDVTTLCGATSRPMSEPCSP